MDIQKKNSFIGRISHALNHNKLPDHILPFPHEAGPQYKMYKNITQAEILQMFRDGCAAFDTKLVETTSKNFLKALLAEVESHPHNKVAYSCQTEINNYGLTKAFAAAGINAVQWDPTLGRDANINNVKDADIGITFAQYGVAETGTIIQASGVECGRSLSLLPDIHIGVLKASTIVPRLTQSMKLLRERFLADPDNFPTNICHISGPSRTADIELVNVMGAHGPIAVTFIMITDL